MNLNKNARNKLRPLTVLLVGSLLLGSGFTLESAWAYMPKEVQIQKLRTKSASPQTSRAQNREKDATSRSMYRFEELYATTRDDLEEGSKVGSKVGPNETAELFIRKRELNAMNETHEQKKGLSFQAHNPNHNPNRNHNGFYLEHARGWFWYEPNEEGSEAERIIAPSEAHETLKNEVNEEVFPKLEALNHEEPKLEISVDPKITKAQEESWREELTHSGLKLNEGRYELVDIDQVRARELKILVAKSLETALDKPTPNSVYNYFFLQKLALDKSQRFANEAQLTMLRSPWLDEMSNLQVSTEARIVLNEEVLAQENIVLQALTKRVGLIFYYKGACRYCKLAVPNINALHDLGFKIIAVSLDGMPLPGLKAFRSETAVNPPPELGITKVPALVYLDPLSKERPLVLASGLISKSELMARLIRVGKASLNDGAWVQDVGELRD